MSREAPQNAPTDGRGLRIGLVASLYNQEWVDELLLNVLRTLDEAGLRAEDVETVRVPGAHELPYALAMLAKTGEFDCLIALGVVLAGETHHHEVIATTTAQAMQRLGIETEVPIINGILVVANAAQAQARVGAEINRGREFGQAALYMAELKLRLVERLDALEQSSESYGSGDGLSWDDTYGNPDKDNPWKL